MTRINEAYGFAPGEGESLWFFNSLATIKAGTEETHGSFSLLELRCPGSFGPPIHVHDREDEGFYVLDGLLTVTSGEREWTLAPGGFAFLPRQQPHAFRTGPEGTRMLQLTSPGQFENFARDLGQPAAALVLPEPGQLDLGRLAAVSERYGMKFMLTPPG